MNFLVDVEDQNIKKEMEISLQASELVGMHYTSIENIHKVIEPLFLDGLKEEFAEIKDLKVLKTKKFASISFPEKTELFDLFGSGSRGGCHNNAKEEKRSNQKGFLEFTQSIIDGVYIESGWLKLL